LSAVLDFIVKKVCCLSTSIGGSTPGASYTEPTLSLPSCLQYVDPATGVTVTQLVHNQFTLRIANQFCSLKATVDQHTSQISTINTTLVSHQTQINNLQASQIPLVTPNCVLPTVPTAVTIVVDALEEQYCILRNQVGASNQVTAAIAQQCSNLAALPALSQVGNMNTIAGWNNTLNNLSQSFQNLWITVCDMRAAINDIKNCCSQVDCSQFILGYTASANNLRQEVYLDFNPGTIIPAGFTNCSQLGSLVTISDGVNSKDFRVDLVTLAASNTIFTAVVAGSGVVGAALNPSLGYTVTVNGCIVKDGKTCEKAVVRTISVPCPIVTTVTATLV
jgi:hypothetical protein